MYRRARFDSIPEDLAEEEVEDDEEVSLVRMRGWLSCLMADREGEAEH